jgi:4a-hydroxytetrahydrobiopterin dehydratase
MSRLEYRRLSDDETQTELSKLDGWELDSDQIAKTFAFKTYKDGRVFATAVGYLADQLDHHPDMAVGYQKVRVSLSTHSVEGISPYDFELAQRIERLGN